MPRTIPARLHVLLASEAPVGLIFRRGPSKKVCSILWNRDTDTFKLGQWLKGRIYERRSDLSPDGKHVIYFAMNGKWQGPMNGSWTAISKAPYLKALTLLAKGDCWNGGGLFRSESTYWLNDGYGHREIHNTAKLRRDLDWNPAQYHGGECPGVYYPRLQRDGWRYLGYEVVDSDGMFSIFEKPAPRGWILRKFARAESNHPPGKGVYWDEHELEHPERRMKLMRPDWEWADLDGSKLVWTEKGCLYRASLTKDGHSTPTLLKDFNEMVFKAIAAPY